MATPRDLLHGSVPWPPVHTHEPKRPPADDFNHSFCIVLALHLLTQRHASMSPAHRRRLISVALDRRDILMAGTSRLLVFSGMPPSRRRAGGLASWCTREAKITMQANADVAQAEEREQDAVGGRRCRADGQLAWSRSSCSR